MKKTKDRNTREKEKEHLNDAKMDLAWELLNRGEYEKGLALYLSVFGEEYQERKYNGVGTALTEMGRYDEAKRILEYGLRKFPMSCALWTDLGILYDLTGGHLESLRCFETALQFAPGDNSGGLYNKAVALIHLNSYEDAISILEDLINKCPEEPKYLAERGFCALKLRYPAESLKYYQRAMEVWKENSGIHEGICIYTGLYSTFVELGMKEEAMEIAMQGVKKFPDKDPALYLNVGAAFLRMGWPQETIEVLKKGLEKFPHDEDLKKFLKKVEENMDDPDGEPKPTLLGLILMTALIQKKLRKKR